MPKIVVRNISFEKALRIFRSSVEKAGVKDDLRKKEFYEKPSARRRQKINSARRRNEREKAKENNMRIAYKLRQGRKFKL